MAQAFQIMKEDIGTAVLPLFEQITALISTALIPIAEALTPIFVKLFEALIPIVEKALPIFVNLLNLISPILDTLLSSLQPLLEAFSPLLDVIELLLAELQPLIEQIMPIFIELVRILVPIIAQLAEALIPIVVQLLPPLLKLFESLIPIINLLADYLINYLLPVFSTLIDKLLPWLIGLINVLTTSLEWLYSILGPVYAAIKPVLDGLLAIAGIKPGELDKRVTFTVTSAYDSAETRRMSAYAFGSVPTSAVRISPQISAGAARGGAGSASIPAAMQDMISSHKQAANQEAGILDKRLSAFESFNDAVKGLFKQIKDSIMSSFELPKLGNSVNSITKNIGKLLEKTKGFAQNISQLAGLGLNPALLQQVIGAGPMAGSQLAAALVGGGSAFVSQLNSAYGEFGSLASGIAGIGTRSAFDNPTVANTYNIEVNGGVGSGPSIGKAIVDAIKSYERTSGAVWQGA
jgi:phage-related protein